MQEVGRGKSVSLKYDHLHNHIVERIWSEVTRVNYPIKAVLVEMIRNDQLNIDNNLHLFCTSWLSVKVACVGVQLFVESWNHHPIPGICCYS